MRWHPLMIKWCLYLRHISSRAYDTLRESKCLKLPSDRTLHDYTHYIPAKAGFQAEVDEHLVREAKLGNLEEWQKHVVILVGEKHVREDL